MSIIARLTILIAFGFVSLVLPAVKLLYLATQQAWCKFQRRRMFTKFGTAKDTIKSRIYLFFCTISSKNAKSVANLVMRITSDTKKLHTA
jgi:hypothetical protein